MPFELMLDIYTRMLRIRLVEEAIANHYPDKHMRCPVHLSIGQESTAAIVGMLLNKTDVCVSTHRAHAHYLGKGGNLQRLIDELHGKPTGCTGGRGGSMHLVDTDVGFMGSTAIVANSIPVGAGLALALQIQNSPAIACVFLGDGAVEEGVFYETINFAAVRQLPVLFVCENNGYSVYSDMTDRQPEGRQIYQMVDAIGVESSWVDGVNISHLYEAAVNAIEIVRDYHRPAFLEVATYRYRAHCGPELDDSRADFAYWLDRDPIVNWDSGLADDVWADTVYALTATIQGEIDAAFA